jgi:hypothetical protein
LAVPHEISAFAGAVAMTASAAMVAIPIKDLRIILISPGD